MNLRENTLKTIRFENPDYIPMVFHINKSCWNHFEPSALMDLMESHRQLFPDYKRPTGDIPPRDYSLVQRKDAPYKDPWGCIWETSDDGITGVVHTHPLSQWDDFKNYRAPDSSITDGVFPVDWDSYCKEIQLKKESGDLTIGGLPHGHTFLRLQDIRGYEALMYDMMDNVPELDTLVGMISDFNYEVTLNYLRAKPDILTFAEDLGMQMGPMLTPESFHHYIKPVYARIMKPAEESGCLIHMHSDGDIRSLVDDMIPCGIDVLNLQDIVNGLDWIRDRFFGKVCIDLDIDRQNITRFGTPREIDSHIKKCVEKLGSKSGGLMLIYGLYPGIPLDNVKALMDALERYTDYYAP